MSFGSRLKEKREALGLKQSDLGALLGVTGSAIGNYENGVSSPKAEILHRVFGILGCDANFLFQDEMALPPDTAATPEEMERLVKKYRSLDLYGREAVENVMDVEYRRCLAARRESIQREMGASEPVVRFRVAEYIQPMSAGTGEPAGQEYPQDIELVKAPPRGTSYLSHVRGDSMEPAYHNGDMVFVHAAEEIPVGAIGVFFMDGAQWIKELGDGVLISHNERYPDIPMRDDIRCQGLVLGVCDSSYFD